MSTSKLTRVMPFRAPRMLSLACVLSLCAGAHAGQHTAPVQVRGYIQPSDNCVVRSQNPGQSTTGGTNSANVSITMNCAVGVDYEVRESVTTVTTPSGVSVSNASGPEMAQIARRAASTDTKKGSVDIASLFGRGTGTDQKFWLSMAAMGQEFIAIADAPSAPGVQKNITISW